MPLDDLTTLSVTSSAFFLVGNSFSSVMELACHSAACRPPTSGGTGGSLPGGKETVSTRIPTSTTSEKQLQGQTTEWGQVPQAQKVAVARVLATEVDGFRDLARVKDADLVEAVLGRMTDNVVDIMSLANPQQASEFRDWYPAAQQLSEQWAKASGVEPRQVAAALAALSPGTVWDHNVEMARHTVDIVVTHADRPLGPKHIDQLNSLLTASNNKVLAAFDAKKAKATAKADIGRSLESALLQGDIGGATVAVKALRTKAKIGDESSNMQAATTLLKGKEIPQGIEILIAAQSAEGKEKRTLTSLARGTLGDNYKAAVSLVSLIDSAKSGESKLKEPKIAELLDPTRLVTVGMMSNELAGLAVRAIVGDGATVPAMSVGSDGSPQFKDLLRTKKGDPTKLRWQSQENLGKAVSVLRDGTLENVSAQLGKAHKVRNFYNNIVDPSDPTSFTADTHAYGIALGIPVGISHSYIATSKGSANLPGRPSHAQTGLQGAYALTQEANRRAMERVNTNLTDGTRPYILREVQSVTWEMWRRAYPAERRSSRGSVKGATERVQSVLARRDRGELTFDQARTEIKSIRESVQNLTGPVLDESSAMGVDF